MGAGTGAEPDVRYARGVAAYARIFGVPEDRLAAAFASRVGPVFAEEQLQAAGGAAWADPALSGRDRSVASSPRSWPRGSPATASSPISTWPGATVSTTMPSPR
jgi:hypothetical protein